MSQPAGGKGAKDGKREGYVQEGERHHSGGRYPANVILDEEAGEQLDGQTGEMKDGVAVNRNRPGDLKRENQVYGQYGEHARPDVSYGSRGGGSRFFFCAKASKRERGEGNKHPTVKPLSLVRYLIRMITPPDGIVLDPFVGSGTTLLAAEQEGVIGVGMERDPDYVELVRQRLSDRTIEALVVGDENGAGAMPVG